MRTTEQLKRESFRERASWSPITEEERKVFTKMGLLTEEEMLYAKSIPMFGDAPEYPKHLVKEGGIR